jgi:YD repeat-containing protein
MLSGEQQQLVTTSSYDQAGRLLWQTSPNGEKTSYDYDLRGNVVMLHPPMGQTQQRVYDQRPPDRQPRRQRQAQHLDLRQLRPADARTDIGGASYAYGTMHAS